MGRVRSTSKSATAGEVTGSGIRKRSASSLLLATVATGMQSLTAAVTKLVGSLRGVGQVAPGEGAPITTAEAATVEVASGEVARAEPAAAGDADKVAPGEGAPRENGGSHLSGTNAMKEIDGSAMGGSRDRIASPTRGNLGGTVTQGGMARAAAASAYLTVADGQLTVGHFGKHPSTLTGMSAKDVENFLRECARFHHGKVVPCTYQFIAQELVEVWQTAYPHLVTAFEVGDGETLYKLLYDESREPGPVTVYKPEIVYASLTEAKTSLANAATSLCRHADKYKPVARDLAPMLTMLLDALPAPLRKLATTCMGAKHLRPTDLGLKPMQVVHKLLIDALDGQVIPLQLLHSIMGMNATGGTAKATAAVVAAVTASAATKTGKSGKTSQPTPSKSHKAPEPGKASNGKPICTFSKPGQRSHSEWRNGHSADQCWELHPELKKEGARDGKRRIKKAAKPAAPAATGEGATAEG